MPAVPSAVMYRGLLVLSCVAEFAVLYRGVRRRGNYSILWSELIATGLFLLALFALSRSRLVARDALIWVVAVGALFQLAAVGEHPRASDDAYRYGWDAKVQLAGIDPYRYAPSDHALDRLRTLTLFPDKAGCFWVYQGGKCSKINRPTVHTIYPPVAEAAFVVSRLMSLGSTDGTFPVQLLGVFGAVLLSLILAMRCKRENGPPWTVAVWAWCPVAVIEIANNGHIDWLAAIFSVLAMMALVRQRFVLAGVMIGAAISTKLYPGLLLASALRKHPVRVVGAALGLVVVSYLPHVAVVGNLPGYLQEEHFLNGGRFLLLGLVLPKSWLTAAAVLAMLAAMAWAWQRTDPERPERTAVIVMGIAMLVLTPDYSWYVLPLLALIAMSGQLEWLPMVITPSVASFSAGLFPTHHHYRALCYLAGVVVVVLASVLRQQLTARVDPGVRART
jgi:alpha-1,2-mannosyltransferase